MPRTICHRRYSDQACDDSIQSLTRFSSSSLFPLNFNPLHFNHRFNWPTVYSSGSLSNLEPGTSSSSVRTVKDGSEPLAIHTFPLQPLQILVYVCLTHDRGLKYFVTSLVPFAILNRYNVADLMHYLDDFLTAGPAGSNQCAQNLQTSLAVCRSLGLPLHPGKCIGPHTRLVVLGIELDSIEQSARLPAEKLAKLQELIHSWRSRRWCTRRQLESLIGHLHHAAKVVWPGRTFLRRMIDLLCCFRARDHPIRLNAEFQLDVQWWHEFLASWRGVSFWLFPGMSAPTDVEVTSDAAGSLGFGAYFNTEWFSGAWAPSQADQSIAYKELFPVVVASHVWGSQWFRRHVLFRSDNEAVVHILLSRTSKVLCIMRLLRLLLSAAARFNFTFTSQHIPGIHNNIADALSRFHWQDFRRLAPWAQPYPVPVPHQLWELLIPPL